jgi:hypothetical protein
MLPQLHEVIFSLFLYGFVSMDAVGTDHYRTDWRYNHFQDDGALQLRRDAYELRSLHSSEK